MNARIKLILGAAIVGFVVLCCASKKEEQVQSPPPQQQPSPPSHQPSPSCLQQCEDDYMDCLCFPMTPQEEDECEQLCEETVNQCKKKC